MNWWDILKQTQQAGLGEYGQQEFVYQQPGQLSNISALQQRAQQTPQLDEQQQYQQAAQQPTQQALNVNPIYNPIQPNVQQPQQQPQTQSTEAGGADSPSDDTDVGSIKENVSRAKQNLTQLPRGPKALQLTQILTDLSAAAIDPVNQRKIAIDAKNKLQQAFPAQS
tara:strand:+ start:922 stop:1422 length:501 start_codon:yes stop_codon:yes gene_type:complete